MNDEVKNPKDTQEEDLNGLSNTSCEKKDEVSNTGEAPQKALDDSRRIKVLSPGMLVFKRFMRSKLAIAGSIILIFMFSFAFLGGIISPYKQDQIFHKYDEMELNFAMATERIEYSPTSFEDALTVDSTVKASLNTAIKSFLPDEISKKLYDTNGSEYILSKKVENVFLLEKIEYSLVGTYSVMTSEYLFSNVTYNQQPFIDAVDALDPAKIPESTPIYFVFSGLNFRVSRSAKTCTISLASEAVPVLFSTTYVFDSYGVTIDNDTKFRYQALLALDTLGTFNFEGVEYELSEDEITPGRFTVFIPAPAVEETEGEEVVVAEDTNVYNISSFVVRRYTGEDTLPVNYKIQLQTFVSGLIAANLSAGEFEYIEETEQGTITNQFKVERKLNSYVVRNNQITYLIDIYGKPSSINWLGTDSNGMDVLTRMMYGGRISLLIGFIVIILETLIGVLLGGIAGYFGKWIDNIIMRLVDIFNCIPFLPIMIILGSVFDKLQLGSYERIMWLMILLGVLGWSGIARLVRGQILSLREQEFMLATEATGLSAKRRIFRHLVPNVMPQLIVNATMGLGGIIITESTLSFLGLGAKYPLATWGAMINSVSDAAALVNYTYIWIPVGILICLTVIAFNFVGDGLRDAFDPKMKR